MSDKNDVFYLRIGSTWTLDGLYIFIITPISFAGFLLNVFSVYQLQKIKISSTKLYKYLGIYTMNSAMICLFLGFSFVSSSPRFFPYYAANFAKIFRCYMFTPIINNLFFFGNIMDIILSKF
jgi:hypothetical protein